MTDRRIRIPVHIAVLVGASTAAYAISMAGVTGLQSSADQAVAADRSPSEAAAARLLEGNDRLQARMDEAAQVYAASAARYEELAANLSTLDTSLEGYAARMAKVSGAAKALPSRVSLPSVSRSGSTTTSKPRVSSTTGASGG